MICISILDIKTNKIDAKTNECGYKYTIAFKYSEQGNYDKEYEENSINPANLDSIILEANKAGEGCGNEEGNCQNGLDDIYFIIFLSTLINIIVESVN